LIMIDIPSLRKKAIRNRNVSPYVDLLTVTLESFGQAQYRMIPSHMGVVSMSLTRFQHPSRTGSWRLIHYGRVA